METPSTGPANFNPELFLNQQYTEASSTEYVLVPAGEYTAVIGAISADSFKSFDIKRGENAGKKAYRLDLELLIEDPDGKLKEMLGRPPKITHGIMLDIKPDGGIEFGKGRNVQLGLLREALNQNATGRQWGFGSMAGQPVKVIVVEDTYDGKPQRKVKSFGKAF